MLERVTAVEFSPMITKGRTNPALLVCEKPDASTVEVVAKFSANCDEGVTNLAREVIAACLAGDLGLPIPEPFLIEVPVGFADAVPEPQRRAKILASNPIAFGSRHVTGQFSAWIPGTRLMESFVPTALAIFIFDAITQNPDRRDENANCLFRGDQCRIFDHELCFTHGVVLGWRPPWILGGLSHLITPGKHIFRSDLVGRALDYSDIAQRWQGLSDRRLMEYESTVPVEWNLASASVKAAISLIRDARDQFDGCLTEIRRVLT